MPDRDPRLLLIYDESVRGWAVQSTALDELRNRAGILLSAASVATALLGTADIEKHAKFTWVGIIAVLVFVAVIALAVGILWPTKWTFTHNAQAMKDEYISNSQSLDFMYDDLATEVEKYRAENAEKLDCRFWMFRVACIALGASIVLWLVDLGKVFT